jgi:hypothetical protein
MNGMMLSRRARRPAVSVLNDEVGMRGAAVLGSGILIGILSSKFRTGAPVTGVFLHLHVEKKSTQSSYGPMGSDSKKKMECTRGVLSVARDDLTVSCIKLGVHRLTHETRRHKPHAPKLTGIHAREKPRKDGMRVLHDRRLTFARVVEKHSKECLGARTSVNTARGVCTLQRRGAATAFKPAL